MIKQILDFFIKRKVFSGVIALVLVGGGYYGYAKFFSTDNAVRYVFAAVERGTLVVSLSGSGQVSASNQVDIKPKVSGEIVYVGVSSGQEVGAWALIAQVDSRSAERALRDAETALETAKLELDKVLESADELTLLQAENSFAQAKESKQKSEDNLKKSYEDGFNTVSNAFLNLPDVMAGIYEVLYGKSFGSSEWNIDYYANVAKEYDANAQQYKEDVYLKYREARAVYDKNFADYKSTSRFSDQAMIENLINQTYETTKLMAEAVKSSNNLIQLYQDKLTEKDIKPSLPSDTHLSSLNAYTATTNTYLVSLLSAGRAIKDAREAIVNAEYSIKEKDLSLSKVKKGADDLDVRARRLAVQQKEDALLSAKETLSDYYAYAPFAGVIAKSSIKKGDQASSATVFATLITKQKIAEISLNEVDIAKVKVGQKATLTFDAIPDLSMTGQVAELDAIGTVSQGVVTYTVKIAFDAEEDKVKPGMSVSASIITDVKIDALLVPSSAVKSQSGGSYVEIPDTNDVDSAAMANIGGITLTASLGRQPIEVGMSNDEFIEIVSGLNVGDRVVTRIIQATAQTAQTATQQGGLRIPGLGGGGGGARTGSGFNR